MQINYKIKQDQKIITVNLSGIYDIDQYKTFYEELMTETNDIDIKGILWDARKLDVANVTQDQIRSIISHISNWSSKRENGKAAWVVIDSISFGMGRMFQIISENNTNIDIRIFKNYEKAEEWIVS